MACSLLLSPALSYSLSLSHSLTHSVIDDSEMDPCHTGSQSELSASDRVPGIRHREGGRSEARQVAGNKTAEGNKHAEEQATGPVEPRRDPEGEGNQAGKGRARRQARNRPQARNIPSVSQPGTRFNFAKAPSVAGPPGQALEELGALFKQLLPCWPWM